jgi:hypothetical protein
VRYQVGDEVRYDLEDDGGSEIDHGLERAVGLIGSHCYAFEFLVQSCQQVFRSLQVQGAQARADDPLDDIKKNTS